MEDTLKVINKDGEIINEITPGDRIIKKKSSDYINNTIKIMESESFVKVFDKNMFELAKLVTGTEMLFIMMMSKYVSYESGKLTHGNNKDMSKKFISEISNKSVRTIERILDKLNRIGVIHIHNKGKVKYFVNPWLFMRGKRINKTLYEMFVNTKWAK